MDSNGLPQNMDDKIYILKAELRNSLRFAGVFKRFWNIYSYIKYRQSNLPKWYNAVESILSSFMKIEFYISKSVQIYGVVIMNSLEQILIISDMHKIWKSIKSQTH